MKHGEEPASPHLSCPQYIHPLMNRSARPRAHWRWRPLLPPQKNGRQRHLPLPQGKPASGLDKNERLRRGRDGRELRWQFREGSPFLQKFPPSPSNLSMHLNADGLMNTSLTERGGLPLLAAWAGRGFRCGRLRPHRLLRTARRIQRTGGPDIQLGLASGYPRIRHPAHDRGLAPAVRLRPAPELASRGRRGLCHTGRREKRHFGCTVAGIVRFMTTIPTVVYGFAAVPPACPRRPRGRGERLRPLLALRSPDARLAHPAHYGPGHGFGHADEGKKRFASPPRPLVLRAPKRWPASCSPPPGAGCSRRLSSGSGAP